MHYLQRGIPLPAALRGQKKNGRGFLVAAAHQAADDPS
jgi:hypothetical protein